MLDRQRKTFEGRREREVEWRRMANQCTFEAKRKTKTEGGKSRWENLEVGYLLEIENEHLPPLISVGDR